MQNLTIHEINRLRRLEAACNEATDFASRLDADNKLNKVIRDLRADGISGKQIDAALYGE